MGPFDNGPCALTTSFRKWLSVANKHVRPVSGRASTKPMFSLFLAVFLLPAVVKSLPPAFDPIGSNTIFFRHNDLLVPLNPILWATKSRNNNEGKMVIAIKLDSADNVKVNQAYLFLAGKQGILPYNEESIANIQPETVRHETAQDQLDKLAKSMGALQGYSEPFKQTYFHGNSIRQADLEALPESFWRSLDHKQLAQVLKQIGIVPVLNHLNTRDMGSWISVNIWGPSSVVLPIDESSGKPITELPGVLSLKEASDTTILVNGLDLINSFGHDIISFTRQLDPAVMLWVARLTENSPDLKADAKSFEQVWLKMIKSMRLFEKIPLISRGWNTLPKKLFDPSSSGKERTEALLLYFSKPIRYNDTKHDGQVVLELVQAYLNDIQRTSGDLGVLRFLQRSSQVVPVQGLLDWNFGGFNKEHWQLVSKLPIDDAYLDLFLMGFLMGRHQLSWEKVGTNRTAAYRAFREVKTLDEKLKHDYILENLPACIRTLAFLVDLDPKTMKLPSSLLLAIANSKDVDPSLKTALIVHAYRQDGRKPWESRKGAHLRPISDGQDCIYNRMKLYNLKAFIAAPKIDSMTYLLPNRDLMQVWAKSQTQGKQILADIVSLVLSDNFDPDDIPLLVSLLEANWQVIRLEDLLAVQRRLLIIDACQLGRIPDEQSMHRMAQIIAAATDSGETAAVEVTLEEVTETIPGLFGVAQFWQVPQAPYDPVKKEEEEVKLVEIGKVVEAFVWSTPSVGLELACVQLLHILSYTFAFRPWSQEMMVSAEAVINGLDADATLNLLNRIYRRADLVALLLTRLKAIGWMVPSTDDSPAVALAPLPILLEMQDDEAGLQELLVGWQKSWAGHQGILPMDWQPVLRRIVALGRSDGRSLEAALKLTEGDLGDAFRLVRLADLFKDLALSILWRVLLAHGKSIGKAAAALRTTVNIIIQK